MKRLPGLLALTITVAAGAATWVPYAVDYSDYDYEYDSSSVTHHAAQGLVLVAWTRRHADNAQTVQRTECHCPSHSYRVTYETRIVATDVTYQANTPTATWQYAMPDTVQWALITHVCTRYK